MKSMLMFVAFFSASAAWAQYNPPSGGGGSGGPNATASSAGAVTSLAVDLTSLGLTSTTGLVVQCWTGTTTLTPVSVTSLTALSNTSVTANFSSTANVVCKVNATGTGPAGATGSAGPKGDKGDTGAVGAKGDTGATGAAGATGATGPAGSLGTDGTTAGYLDILTGSAPSSPSSGYDRIYLDTANGFGCLKSDGSSCIAAVVIPTQYKVWTCETGLGDGLNAITAGTYLQRFCYNTTGVTVTLTGLKCFTDNAGASTMNGSGVTLGALLTGAMTCSSTIATGTQSANVALTNGDAINFTFVADGTSKQTTWLVTGTY